MACESERRAYEDAKNRVKALRTDLKDMTGSDKLGGGAPTGESPEGATGANEQLEEVRQSLADALEALTNARVALANCTGAPVDPH